MKLDKAKLKMPAGKSGKANAEHLDASESVADALEPEAGGGGAQGEDGNGLNHISDEELISEIRTRGISMSRKPAPLKNMEASMDAKSKSASTKPLEKIKQASKS